MQIKIHDKYIVNFPIICPIHTPIQRSYPRHSKRGLSPIPLCMV